MGTCRGQGREIRRDEKSVAVVDEPGDYTAVKGEGQDRQGQPPFFPEGTLYPGQGILRFSGVGGWQPFARNTPWHIGNRI